MTSHACPTIIYIRRHLPYLQHVVIRYTRNDTLLVEIPTEVGDLIGVTAMDEQQLGGTIFGVVRILTGEQQQPQQHRHR